MTRFHPYFALSGLSECRRSSQGWQVISRLLHAHKFANAMIKIQETDVAAARKTLS
jgi:hypothetical protein